MGRADDLAAFLDEDPFGECGPGTPAPRAARQYPLQGSGEDSTPTGRVRQEAPLGCPLVVYTDLDTSFCKMHLTSTPQLAYSRMIGAQGRL
jgi:hypothetical protein